MRLVPVIILAIVLLAAPLVWLLVKDMMPAPEFGSEGGSAIDSGARIEIEALRQQIEALQEQIASLETEIRGIGAGSGEAQDGFAAQPQDTPFVNEGPNAIIDAYAQVVLIANRRNVNRGITVASPSFLEGFLGRPREVLSDDCEPMTNPKLKDLLRVEDVGPIRVQMLQPAIDSLKRVFKNVEEADPDLYARISTAGSLCVRRIRGTIDRTSTHSFGLAVDLNIDGKLDSLADGKTQLGLTILADFFNAEGWVWGAGFSREDSMHFEVSQKQLETWRAEGNI
ncbi:M15 family metallopeptidase [Paracoccaceae bacterium Fryx2]|nr:M15 family metallopeptidase [Paracoccaceae bacterium Fryx2]